MVSVISILLWVSLEETQKLMSNGLTVPVLFVCQDPRFRNRGTTDGVFRCQRYFRCTPGAGMFVSLDKITISVAEEFNVRTGKAQEITSQGPLSEYVWPMITFGATLTWDQALFFCCCCCCCFFGLRGKKVIPDTFIWQAVNRSLIYII